MLLRFQVLVYIFRIVEMVWYPGMMVEKYELCYWCWLFDCSDPYAGELGLVWFAELSSLDIVSVKYCILNLRVDAFL
jgi:hypothetical protein